MVPLPSPHHDAPVLLDGLLLEIEPTSKEGTCNPPSLGLFLLSGWVPYFIKQICKSHLVWKKPILFLCQHNLTNNNLPLMPEKHWTKVLYNGENSFGYPRLFFEMTYRHSMQTNAILLVFICLLQMVSPRWGYFCLLEYHLCKPI